MQAVAKISSTPTMSSLEIAEMTGKTPSNVTRDIKVMCEQLGYSNLNSNTTQGVTVVLNDKGQIREVLLDRDHALTLVTGYDAKARMAINRRWVELEDMIRVPKTFIEAMQLATQTLIENESLKEEVRALTDQRDDLQIELDQSMEWLSIKKVAAYNNLHWKQIPWLPLKRHGIQTGRIPHKVFDANFPDGVNMYHRESWIAVYPHLVMPGDET